MSSMVTASYPFARINDVRDSCSWRRVRWTRHLVAPEVDLVLAGELQHQPIHHDAAVEVVTAEERVAGGSMQ